MYKEQLKYVNDNISKDLDRLELIRDTLGRLYVQYDINLKIIKSKLWYNCTSRIIVENTNMLFSAVHKLDYCKLDFISKLSYPISYIEDNNEEVFKQVTEAMAKFIALLETEMAKIQNEHINLLKSFGLLISNYEIHLEDYVPEVIVNSKVNFEDVRKDYDCNCGCNNKPSEEEKDDNIIDAEVEEPVVEDYNLVYNSSTNANLNNNQKHNKAMEALEAKYKLTATDRNILNSNKGNPRKLFNHHTANSATNNSFNPDTSFILN